MAKESAMFQRETKITCAYVIRFAQWPLLVSSYAFCAWKQSVQSAAVPREGQARRSPPGYFAEPQQFGGAPPSPGAAGGGRASLPRGSREERGNSAAEISMGLWAVDLKSDLIGLSLGNYIGSS